MFGGADPSVCEFLLGPISELLPLYVDCSGGSSGAGPDDEDDFEDEDRDAYNDGDVEEDGHEGGDEGLRSGSAFGLARSMQQSAGAEGLRVRVELGDGQQLVVVSRA